MDFDEIVVKDSPGLCRCCLSEGCYKDLSTEYTWMGENEIYADMLFECFDISITQHTEGPNGSSRLICEVCITRLRDACNFKKQVLESEKKFVDMVGRGDFKPKAVIILEATPLKTEFPDPLPGPSEDDCEIEYLDEDDYTDGYRDDEPLQKLQAAGITVSSLSVKGKRGKKRSADTTKPVKAEKKKKTEGKSSKSKSSKGGQRKSKREKRDMRTERDRRDELVKVLYHVLECSNVMPFRWYGNRYMCFYCCCTFNDCDNLKNHTKSEHEDAVLTGVLRNVSGRSSVKVDISNLACKKCDLEFVNFQNLIQHIAERHDAVFDAMYSKLIIPFKLSNGPMSCLQCGDLFRFFGPLLGHTHKAHSDFKLYLCEVCGQGFFSKLNVGSHIKTAHPGNLKCGICDKVFSSYYSLRKHCNAYHETHKLKCPKCSLVLGSMYLKKRHLAIVHDVKSEQFHCDICSKLFTMKCKLESHKRRVHLKERLISCEICGFKVFDSHQLKNHLITHTETRPFQCEFCKKTFQRAKTLDFHRRIHTNDRRYPCVHCGRSFVQAASLKVHLKVHHPNNESVSGVPCVDNNPLSDNSVP